MYEHSRTKILKSVYVKGMIFLSLITLLIYVILDKVLALAIPSMIIAAVCLHKKQILKYLLKDDNFLDVSLLLKCFLNLALVLYVLISSSVILITIALLYFVTMYLTKSIFYDIDRVYSDRMNKITNRIARREIRRRNNDTV